MWNSLPCTVGLSLSLPVSGWRLDTWLFAHRFFLSSLFDLFVSLFELLIAAVLDVLLYVYCMLSWVPQRENIGVDIFFHNNNWLIVRSNAQTHLPNSQSQPPITVKLLCLGQYSSDRHIHRQKLCRCLLRTATIWWRGIRGIQYNKVLYNKCLLLKVKYRPFSVFSTNCMLTRWFYLLYTDVVCVKGSKGQEHFLCLVPLIEYHILFRVITGPTYLSRTIFWIANIIQEFQTHKCSYMLWSA